MPKIISETIKQRAPIIRRDIFVFNAVRTMVIIIKLYKTRGKRRLPVSISLGRVSSINRVAAPRGMKRSKY